MTDKQIMDMVEHAMMIGRKEAYTDMFRIVSDMDLKDGNDSLKKLVDITFEKALHAVKEEA